MHIGSNKVSVCGAEICKTSYLPRPTVAGQPADKVPRLLLCFLALFGRSSLSVFPLADS